MGLSDIQLLSLLGPSKSEGLVWDLGRTFKFPTASDEALGEDKYQAGPAGLPLSMRKPWVGGILALHYSVIKPDSFGTEWNFQFQVTPVIPSPFAKR